MVSDVNKQNKTKVNPCAKRVMANSVLCTKCGKWVHGRYAQMKRVTWTLAKSFICEQCVEAMKGIVGPAEEITFYDQMELVKSFCHLGDRLNPSDGSEMVMTARMRIGWIKFRECKELLNGRKLSLKMKK